MNKGNQTLMRDALDGLLSVGTVRGVCLGRGGEVLVNRFPFSDGRLLCLCREVEQVLENFAEQGREVERMVFGFDGGHLVLQVDGDVRLLIMHLIPDEADFVAKAGQAFLADNREAIVSADAMPIEIQVEGQAEFELETDSETAAEDERSAKAEESEGEGEEKSQAAAARSIQPPDQEAQQLVVSKPGKEELPLDSSPPGKSGTLNPSFLELLEASREQKIDDAVLAADPNEDMVEVSQVEAQDESALTDWAAQHLDLPGDGSLLPGPKTPRRSAVRKAVVGVVKVQPVRLAAQQPQSTLPPPKKPRVRRAKEMVEEA